MIGVQLQGGLGNQLFQIYTAIAYSLENYIPFILPETKYDMRKRGLYWSHNSFLHGMKRFTSDQKIAQLENFKYIEPKFSFSTIPIKEHILLHGYFQSYKYFEKHSKNITRLLQIPKKQEAVKENLRVKYADKFKEDPITISLHFRLGDYKSLSDFHPIMTDDYYLYSLIYIIKSCRKENKPFKVFYFCESENNDEVFLRINKYDNFLKARGVNCEFVKVSDEYQDWEQLLIMSICNHNIIANSSFSWWGAYLNENKNNIVMYPERWFGRKMQHHDLSDLFPITWNKQK
tara:strand:+ start:171 stop:1037 length:867 start_codon:yes stop_codon:yes gene_type:complete